MKKKVLITGASLGIGYVLANRFSVEGSDLILTGRRNNRLEELGRLLQESNGTEVKILVFDVRNHDEVKEQLESLPEDWKAIDILINNAGLAKGLSTIDKGDTEHWDQMIDTNIKGLLYVTRTVSPWMVAAGKGHIINISSIAGKEVYPNGNVYCASKFAVDALSRAIRIDLHTKGIRVSQISPGAVEETEFALVRFDGDVERAKIYNDFQPLKASDVADAVYYMASCPPHVNIQDITILATQQASAAIIDRSGR
ncbi:MAG: SDR family NAD(P)-dependent oxidoreductase [Saprospiraceae bacterium]|nr:SDR family NAD(P)-dependent oxidoreductase [Saprospiraceae bacterium]